MIRDPSDGSVREKTLVHQATVDASTPIGHQKTEAALPASGLPNTRLKPDDLARLKESREWLENYHRKGTAT